MPIKRFTLPTLALATLAGALALASPARAQPAPPAAAPPATAPPAAAPPAAEGAAPKKVPGWAEVPAAPPRSAAPPPRPPVDPQATPLGPEDEREAPDFDGREDTSTAGDAALWVPRVALYPAYLATDFLIRRPLGAITMWVEEDDIIGKLEDLFTFGPNGNLGLVPTGLIDFGFRPSVGVYFFWKEFLDEDNALRVNVATGGRGWYKAIAADRIDLGGRSYLQLEADVLQRPDLLFWGIGPSTRDEAEGSYSQRTVGGGVRLRMDIDRQRSFFESWATVRASAFDNGGCGKIEVREGEGAGPLFGCGDDTIFEQVEAGRYTLPDGFGGYSVVKTGARVVLDSRAQRPAPGNGIAIDMQAEHGGQVAGADIGSWASWGATAAGFLDITGTQRVLSLSLTARFADPLDGEHPIPFTELVGSRRVDDVPDGELLHGFRPGRLVGRSATVAALEYRWPVWTFLDGVMQAGVGNTFGEHLEDFEPQLLRFAFSGGLRTANHRDHSFNLLLGAGTETFASGAELTSVRFLFGGTTGF